MLNDSPEYCILAYTVTNLPDFVHRKKLLSLLKNHADPERLITISEKEGMAGLLYDRLKRTDALRCLSENQTARLRSIYYRIVGNNLRLESALNSLLTVLIQRNISVVVLKGMALLHTIYPNNGLRPMGDIDLWVYGGHFARFSETLLELGYDKDPLYPGKFRKDGIIVDTHTHLLWADRIRARKYLVTKSQSCFLRRAQLTQIADRQARILDPYDQVLYLSMHALKHNVNQLIGLADIKLIVDDWSVADWKRLMDRSEEMGQKSAVGCICFLLQHLMKFDPPKDVRRLFFQAGPNTIERWILKERINGGNLPIWANLLLLRPRGDHLHLIIYILETLMPREEILRQVFGMANERRAWRLFLMRVRQLGRMAVDRILF